MTKPNIRLANISDAQSIATVLANINDYPQWTDLGATALEPIVRKSLLAQCPDRSVFVAEVDDQLVGYAAVYWLNPMFSGREGYLNELFICSSASGHRVGTALLETIKVDAKMQKCSRLTLINLKDRESYRRGFYAKRGWEEKLNTVRFVINL
jgi:GNAT superfamily N-acetyltransferase